MPSKFLKLKASKHNIGSFWATPSKATENTILEHWLQAAIIIDPYYSMKKRQHSLDILKAFFIQYSSEYKTSDSDQQVNQNI